MKGGRRGGLQGPIQYVESQNPDIKIDFKDVLNLVGNQLNVLNLLENVLICFSLSKDMTKCISE
jgi:hypothetical protein